MPGQSRGRERRGGASPDDGGEKHAYDLQRYGDEKERATKHRTHRNGGDQIRCEQLWRSPAVKRLAMHWHGVGPIGKEMIRYGKAQKGSAEQRNGMALKWPAVLRNQ